MHFMLLDYSATASHPQPQKLQFNENSHKVKIPLAVLNHQSTGHSPYTHFKALTLTWWHQEATSLLSLWIFLLQWVLKIAQPETLLWTFLYARGC